MGDLTGWEYPDEEEKIRDWLFNKTHNRDRRFLVIEYNAHPIGDIELCNIAWRSGHAELKVCIAEKQYWNKGLGTRAINMVLEEAFEHLGLEEVYLRVYGKTREQSVLTGKLALPSRVFAQKGSRLAGDLADVADKSALPRDEEAGQRLDSSGDWNLWFWTGNIIHLGFTWRLNGLRFKRHLLQKAEE